MSKSADLYILTDFNFSSRTGAAYSRMLNFAVLSTKYTDSKCYISNIGADYLDCQEIEQRIYIDTPKIKIQKNRLYRIFKTHINYIETLKYLKKSYNFSKKNSVDSVFLIHTGGFALTFIGLFYFRVFKKVKVLYEKNELVIGIALISEFNGVLNFFPIRFILKAPIFLFSLLVDFFTVFYNGIITISSRLDSLYRRFNKNTVLIPILVSEDFFSIKKKKGEKIIFSSTGGILPKKEGVEEFLLILSKLNEKGIKFTYNIYGDTPAKFIKKVNSSIDGLNLSKSVNLCGYISNEKIKEVLAHSDFLVLTRPKNIQNNFGFSTKLAEFLASGTPVILTDVSDNKKYLTNNIDSIFVDLDNIEKTANQLIMLIDKSNLLDEIGLAAKNKAKEVFDNKVNYPKFNHIKNQ